MDAAAFCRSLGVDCTAMKHICVKSTGHFRSGFEAIAGSIFNVDSVSMLSQDWTKLGFKRLGRAVYPLDQGVELELGGSAKL